MKKISLLVVLALTCLHPSLSFSLPPISNVQKINTLFEKIRTQENLLTTFLCQMPKGGDLHHHYSGSVYAETYLEYAIQKDFYLNTQTLSLSINPIDSIVGKTQFKFSDLQLQNKLHEYKFKLLKKWSIKDFNNLDNPSYKQFFETFLYFDIPSNNTFEKGLLELKQRAKTENVAYIETMLKSIRADINLKDFLHYNDSLWLQQQKKDTLSVHNTLNTLYQIIQTHNPQQIALQYNKNMIERLHQTLQIDDQDFTMRYQNYVLRFKNPIDIFKDLIVAFESAQASPLVVGVNIVAPEHEEVSMRDYWLHMQMYNYCKTKYPSVKYAMHAGELTLGLVKPEDLTWHIQDAVLIAQPLRIGHGVDLPHEKNALFILQTMQKNNIAVEINLFSNEFILNVKNDQHPLMMYKKANVPIVIASDDAGVLRDNLTHQFILLAQRYPQISYLDIKQFVFNSIQYAFIKEPQLKQSIINQLTTKFNLFEQQIINTPLFQ